MALKSGTKLGPYEILSPLGAGGMGEVYLARDSKLDRSVAIKVLPETMTRDKERVARFEREAKLLASLNHPNIAAIFGFDESDGTRFLVMEYVEGETLGSHLGHGPVAVEDALDIAKQIAEALEAAHGQGVIHRDLKPANVILRPDGAVKVLDFGLAKAMADDPSGSEMANSPTITANYTRPGVVLGTAAYMSPEQARGRALDKRTDIWSFGIILFECLTGQTLFRGETATDSMGAIMHKDPEWSLLPPNTPPTIQLLLRRCLTKDRKRRLHDVADARIELENALVDPTSTSLGLAAAVLDGPHVQRAWRWAALLAVVFAAVGAVTAWVLKPPPPSRVARLTMSIPPQYVVDSWRGPVLSPDGRQVLIHAQESENASRILMVRGLDQKGFRQLAGTDDARQPFFSPDGTWIAFEQDDKLKKMTLRGESPITLCDAPSMRGGTWAADGSIIFAPDNTGGLMRIPASGGTPEPFTTPGDDSAATSHRFPYALPDGRGVLLTSTIDYASWDRTSVMVVSGAGGAAKELIKGGKGGRYVAPGYLVFQRENTLLVARFDLDRLELSSAAVPVMEGVAGDASWQQEFSIDDHGTLMYIDSTESDLRLVFVDRLGNEEPIGKHIGRFGRPRLSPDGRFIAMGIRNGSEWQLGVLELERDILRVFRSSEEILNWMWAPDGLWLAVAARQQSGLTDLYRVRADLSGKLERLTQSERPRWPEDWAPDGLSLLFTERIPPTGEGDVKRLRFDEQGNVKEDSEVIADGPNWQVRARYSPNGKWISYSSYESGDGEIFVRPSDGSGTPVRVSTSAGRTSRWSPTEDVIYYLGQESGQLTLYAVKYTVTEGKLAPLAPEIVFTPKDLERHQNEFEVTKDGNRFLFVVEADKTAASVRHEPNIVLNWTKELEELLPK